MLPGCLRGACLRVALTQVVRTMDAGLRQLLEEQDIKNIKASMWDECAAGVPCCRKGLAMAGLLHTHPS